MTTGNGGVGASFRITPNSGFLPVEMPNHPCVYAREEKEHTKLYGMLYVDLVRQLEPLKVATFRRLGEFPVAGRSHLSVKPDEFDGSN